MGSTLRPPDAAGLITARGIPWARSSSRQVVDTGDRGLRGEESLLPRRTQRGNELRDLVAVARIAAGDPLLDLVEQGDECVPGSDAGEPCHRVDGLGEKADVLRGQPRASMSATISAGSNGLAPSPSSTTSCQTLRARRLRINGSLRLPRP